MSYVVFKRVFDSISAFLLLVVLSPLLFIIILISGFVHGFGNIFFLQERVGYKKKMFKVIKFKTMTDAKDDKGELLPDEERQTRWGNFLRRCSFDELLQLINVLKGDMSLIGPRPLIAGQVCDATPGQQCRFDVRPGITGLAQVCGRNDLEFEHRFRYDVWYVNHMNLGLDMQILVMTVKVVCTGVGVEYNPTLKRTY